MKPEQNKNALEGFLIVNKPSGMTSAYCLEKIKHAMEEKAKVGHAGTLDSFATGLLIVGIGRAATRELASIMKLDKQYQATGKLGQLTDTLDFTGTTIQEIPSAAITQQQLEQAIAKLGKQYHQIPPLYSALKFEGKPLSTLVRKQRLTPEELDAIAQEKGREVKLYECKLSAFNPPFFSIVAHVSHGTYIRSLINDIAKLVNSVATTHELTRTAVGPFNVAQAKPLAELTDHEKIRAACISVESMVEKLVHYHANHH